MHYFNERDRHNYSSIVGPHQMFLMVPFILIGVDLYPE